MAGPHVIVNPFTGRKQLSDRVKGPLTAAKTGDWAKAGRVLRGLITTAPEVSAIVAIQAQRSEERITSNIEQQRYNWPELADSTKEKKAAQGLDHRMLIARKDYLNAIQVIAMGPNLWGIGILRNAKNSEGRSLAMIGISHEYGLGGNPPRPHWRREYVIFQTEVSLAVSAYLNRKISL